MRTDVPAVAPAAAVTVFIAGVTVSPEVSVAFQVTLAGVLPAELSTATVTLVLAPGATRTCAGVAVIEATVDGGKCTGPAPYDGGASAAALPQDLSAWPDSEKSSTWGRPFSVIHGCWVACPSTLRPVT